MTRTPKQRALAAVLCAAGGALVLLASGRPWARDVQRQPAPVPGNPAAFLEVARDLSGRDVFPAGAALGLVAVAGAGALVATHGRPRRASGVLVAAAGLAIVGGSVHAMLDPDGALRNVGSVGPWAWLGTAGGATVALAGFLAAATRHEQGGLDSRHEQPRTAVAKDETDDLWDRVERGDPPRSLEA